LRSSTDCHVVRATTTISQLNAFLWCVLQSLFLAIFNLGNSFKVNLEFNLCSTSEDVVSRDIVVGRATGYWLDDRGVGVQVPVGSKFALLHVIQTRSGGHPTSYPMGTGGSFLGGKVAGA
jgi:hypothetical protein